MSAVSGSTALDTPVGPSQDELREMTPDEFVSLVRARCEIPGHGMSNHPFVLAVEAGTATIPQLRLLTEQFYLHIRNMLPSIGRIFVACPHEEVRTKLIRNLAEECLGTFTATAAHPELLLRFGEAVGLDAATARHADQLPVGRRLTDMFEFMSSCRPWYVPLAAIGIGLESFVPETFTRLVVGFTKNYGFSADQLLFWTMHIVADSEHGDEGIELVSSWAVTPEARRLVFDYTVETSERFHALWNVFSRVA